MKISKHTFSVLTVIYFAWMVISALSANTTATGAASQQYFWAMVGAGFMTLWSFQNGVANRSAESASSAVQAIKESKADDDAIDLDLGHWGATDYVYYLVVIAVCAYNFYGHYTANTNATGAYSVWSAVWSLADLGIAVMSASQVYLIATKKLVKVVPLKKVA